MLRNKMILKQISLTIPENLLEASKEYYQELGYRNLQEFILDLIRKRVIIDNIKRYKEIEKRMQKNIGVKKFNQKDAIKYLEGL